MWRAELEAIQIEIPTQGNAERNTSSDKCKAVHKCTGWVDRWLLEPSSNLLRLPELVCSGRYEKQQRGRNKDLVVTYRHSCGGVALHYYEPAS